MYHRSRSKYVYIRFFFFCNSKIYQREPFSFPHINVSSHRIERHSHIIRNIIMGFGLSWCVIFVVNLSVVVESVWYVRQPAALRMRFIGFKRQQLIAINCISKLLSFPSIEFTRYCALLFLSPGIQTTTQTSKRSETNEERRKQKMTAKNSRAANVRQFFFFSFRFLSAFFLFRFFFCSFRSHRY